MAVPSRITSTSTIRTPVPRGSGGCGSRVPRLKCSEDITRLNGIALYTRFDRINGVVEEGRIECTIGLLQGCEPRLYQLVPRVTISG